ncbi:MAG TPA: hypothetical protein VHQ65_14940 [Thermoanaerobaculia bacterium]|nr:hypothetical protein [Thermoanaerobaculia bacterium]
MLNQLLGGRARQDPLAAARLLSGVIAGGVVTFAAIVLLLISGVLGEPLGLRVPPPPVIAALAVAAAAFLVAAPLVERVLLRKAGRDGYVTAKTVGMVLRELPGILGALLGLLTGSSFWVLALPAASLLAIALGWPRAGELAAVGGGEPGTPPSGGPPIEPR